MQDTASMSQEQAREKAAESRSTKRDSTNTKAGDTGTLAAAWVEEDLKNTEGWNVKGIVPVY